MPGFVKVVDDTHVNGTGGVSIKTYQILRRALLEELKFSVIRAQGMGDVLMSVIVIKAMKRMYPNSEISFYAFAQYLPLIKRFDFIDRVGTLEEIDTSSITVDLMGRVDFLPLCNKGHRLDLLADEAGVPRELLDKSFSFTLTATEEKWAAAYLKKFRVKKSDRLIGIHLKSYADIRTWDGWLELTEMILERTDFKVVWFEKDAVKTPAGLPTERIINAAGALSITETMSVMHACNVLVCPDSGLMHLAGMLRVPCVALFGPIDPDFRVRYYPTVDVLWLNDEVSCAPCWDWQIHSCKSVDYKKCMKDITAEMVFERLQSKLGLPSKRNVKRDATRPVCVR